MKEWYWSEDWFDAIIFRPALICGKNTDRTDRFYCWLYRAKMNDKILMPESCILLTQNTFGSRFCKAHHKAINTEKSTEKFTIQLHAPVSIFDVVNTCSSLLKHKTGNSYKASSFWRESDSSWMDIAMWLGKVDFLFDMQKAEDFVVEFDSFDTAVGDNSILFGKNWLHKIQYEPWKRKRAYR